MKKELKEMIKKNKISDDQLMKLINKSIESQDDNTDIMNESEESADSKEQTQAEKDSATENSNKNLTMKDFKKLLNESVALAFKDREEADKLPSQKPLKKSTPKAKNEDNFTIGGFSLMG